MDCFAPLDLPIYVNGIKTKSYRQVPCGKCAACRERNQQGWIFRLTEELKHCKIALFCTYTYEDTFLPWKRLPDGSYVHSVNKRDVQLYLKRLRKRLEVGSLRYYFVSEYGSQTHRPHYHAILFYSGQKDFYSLVTLDWHFGFVKIGSVTINSIAYTTKYVLKDTVTPHGAAPPFALTSRKPALGLCYISNEQTQRYHDFSEFVVLDGRKIKLPRYYDRKLHPNREADSSNRVYISKSEKEFFSSHPDSNYEDFYKWRKSRQIAFVENHQKRSKHNQKL